MFDVTFRDPGVLSDWELYLELAEQFPGDPSIPWPPCYRFKMRLVDVDEPVGGIEFRLSVSQFIVTCAGQLGFGVEPGFRGRRLAARSCRLLVPLARAHGLEELWLTCVPENVGSRRACEEAGAVFVEIVDTPPESNMYKEGEVRVCRYRLPVTLNDRGDG